MENLRYPIKLNMENTGSLLTSIRLKQGDSAIIFVLRIYKNGQNVFSVDDIPSIVFNRPDGSAVVGECSVAEGQYTYKILGNELQYPGQIRADVKFDIYTETESSTTFLFECVKDTLPQNIHGAGIYVNSLKNIKDYLDQTVIKLEQELDAFDLQQVLDAVNYVQKTADKVETLMPEIRDVTDDISSINSRIDNLVVSSGGDSPIEVIDAHVGTNGTTYNTLKTRLDAENTELKSDLVDIGRNFRSDNLINKNKILSNTWLNTDGTTISDNDYCVSDFIDITEYSGTRGNRLYYTFNGFYGTPYPCRRVVAYDSSKNVISSSDLFFYYDLPDDAYYIRLCISNTAINKSKLNNNLDDKTYRDYYDLVLPDYKKQQDLISDHIGLSILIINPMFEQPFGENFGYVKFDALIIRPLTNVSYSKTWEDIIKSEHNPDGLWTVPSYQGVANCAFIGFTDNVDYKIIYDFSTNSVKYTTAELFNENSIVIAQMQRGILTGVLAEYITQKNEKDYYQHRYRNLNENILDSHIKPKVGTAVKSIPSNGITFGYFSDNHGRPDIKGYTNLTIKYLNVVDRFMNLDFILNAGDVIFANDMAPLSSALYSIVSQNSELDNIDKQIIAIGNHDQNGGTLHSNQSMEWTVTHKMFFNSCYRYLEKEPYVVWGSKSDLYFYKDFVDKKIRLIVLNSNDAGEETKTVDGVECLKYNSLVTIGFRQEQLNWLANVALNFSDKNDKSEWHTMICCHVGVRQGIRDNDPVFANYAPVETVINAFKNGTSGTSSYVDSINDGLFTTNISVDYTTQGSMPFIGMFSGHCHCDNIYTENYPQITILAGYIDKGCDNVDRTPETSNEFAFDIVSVDKDTRKVTLTRFGAGSDREYTY